MPRPAKRPKFAIEPGAELPVLDAPGVVQVKVWLPGISPMVWRRVLVSGACTLRELHGVIQIAMGWEGIHLYQFCLRFRRYVYRRAMMYASTRNQGRFLAHID